MLTVAAGFAPVGTLRERLDDTVAVGVPPATFRNPNVAEVVEVPPRSKSLVIFAGANAPLFNCQYPDVPPVEGVIIFCA